MKNKQFLWIVPIVCILAHGCKKSKLQETQLVKPAETAETILPSVLGLRHNFSAYFPIGVAAGTTNISDPIEGTFMPTEFNSFTPDNALKWVYIHPTYSATNPETEGYSWTKMDAIVAYAQANGMKIRGHVLVWHNPVANPKYNGQNYGWVTRNTDGTLLSKTEFFKRMQHHINAVMKRYKGKVYAWDVVNEAVADDLTQGDTIKEYSDMYKIAKAEYISKAFQFARAADPDALLFYNDYNHENYEKRERIYNLLSKLKSEGVPIDGIGMQSHWWSNEPTEPQLRSMFDKFIPLGLKIHITEMDVSVYPHEASYTGKTAADYDITYNAAQKAQQEVNYDMIGRVFKDYKAFISSVTFWNVCDKYSGRSNWPVDNRTDYPLLFDKDCKRKTVYYSFKNGFNP